MNSFDSHHPQNVPNYQIITGALHETGNSAKKHYRYLPFVIGASLENLMRGVKNYVTRKHYNTSFGDLVPVIAARALKIGLIVLKNVQSVYNIHVIEHHSKNGKVFVVKMGDHHDTVVVINDEPLCVENNVERLVVTHIMLRNAENDIVDHGGRVSTDAAYSLALLSCSPGLAPLAETSAVTVTTCESACESASASRARQNEYLRADEICDSLTYSETN